MVEFDGFDWYVSSDCSYHTRSDTFLQLISGEMELCILHCMACISFSKSPSHQAAFTHQVRSIACRMSLPHIPDQIQKQWKRVSDMHERLIARQRVKDSEKTCFASICEYPEAVDMMCSKCKKAYYCSRECQRRYVYYVFEYILNSCSHICLHV